MPERVFLDDAGKWWIAESWNDPAKCYVPESRLLAAEARVREVEAELDAERRGASEIARLAEAEIATLRAKYDAAHPEEAK